MDGEHGRRNNAGRIIVLGDGTEVLTDSADSDMFDHDDDEDKDVTGGGRGNARGAREGTPGPNEQSGGSGIERTQTPEHTDEGVGRGIRFGGAEEPKMKAVNDAVPSKFTSPGKN